MNLSADSIIPCRREPQEAVTALPLPGEQLPGIAFVFRLKRDGTYCAAAASDPFCALYRVSREILHNNAQPVFDAVHPDDLDGFVSSILKSARNMSLWRHEYRLQFADGAEHQISGSALPILTEEGDVTWYGILTVGSARRDTSARTDEWARHSHLLMQTVTDGIHIVDEDGFLVEANDAFGQMLGRDSAQMLGMHISEWNAEEDTHKLRRSFADLIAARSKGALIDTHFCRLDGQRIDVQIYATVTAVGDRVYVYCSSRDVTNVNRTQNEMRIAAIAFQGPEGIFITDASKKVIRANSALVATTGYTEEQLIGMNPFRERLADQNVHESLWAQVGSTGTWRGELTLLRRNGASYTALLELSAVTDRQGNVSHYVGRETDISELKLIQQANSAMYHAKAQGRDTMRVFTPSMESPKCAQVVLEADILRGLQNDEFVLYFQPQLEHEKIVGAELLVRWEHPSMGLLLPAAFIECAEQCDLIVALGNWVLECACSQLADWAGHPLTAPLSLSVNVSARQFRQKDFVSHISSVLRCTGANPSLLTIELTESLLIDNVEETISKMEMLKQMGVCCSLDDFGVCYSSLTYLKDLPFTEMKIDQAFVRDIVAEPKNAAIVRAIIVLGESLGLKVVAEGVETETQRAFLTEHGCTRQQGYLHGRPVPLSEFASTLPWQK